MTDLPYGFTWSFVALEYYALILNRIYLVCVGSRVVTGLYMGGPVAGLPFPETAWDPGFWISERRMRRYAGTDVSDPRTRSLHLFNFQLARDAISRVRFNGRPKWGMGPVPCSGRIHIDWAAGPRREFILLGRQDGPGICERLRPMAARQAAGADSAVPAPVFRPLSEPLPGT